ncbi:hypothetical protein TGAM01_v203758 [Trichoderma gamsii]|uniref:Uncharacterized protein n=1 Tax=Trichoderma gamsii TaxID=398673 RepID=A0A2P4ZSY3_9HYPO|nr:hypothetical protein TGAM01_v203758 [Trichoderma gamsii]PON27377.1 hypothetical protein TGAM01_v203758 [Trichoderma gamsii]
MASSITGNKASSGATQSNTWIKLSLLEHNINTTPNAAAPMIAQDIKNNNEDDKERKLLDDLSSVSGDYARYKNINPERVPGTCEWFLGDDRFCEWRDSQTGALL